jgi:WD40-like Beta Propeller Repeat
MRRLRHAGVALAFVLGCATAAVTETPPAQPPQQSKTAFARSHRTTMTRAPDVELFFRGEQPFARRGEEEWSLGDVTKGEMIFSPDGKKFAYVREKGEATRVLVRNLAGDPINEFTVYRPGHPDDLVWLDNHRIGYVAPPERARPKPGHVYVVHDVDTGEIIAARTTAELTYGPQRRHVAFVSGAGAKQNVVVDGRNVWPRAGVTHVIGEPVWSPDGHGLAFVENGAAGPRLVVQVEFDDSQGDLTWNVPREAIAPGLKVFWAGDSKVVIGESALRPRFAADWKRE